MGFRGLKAAKDLDRTQDDGTGFLKYFHVHRHACPRTTEALRNSRRSIARCFRVEPAHLPVRVATSCRADNHRHQLMNVLALEYDRRRP
jgi:hypothetical protein